MNIIRTAALLVSALAVSAAQASLINIKLDVDAVDVRTPCALVPTGSLHFGCLLAGDQYYGSFDVPDSVFATDGIKYGLPITGFVFTLKNFTWRQGVSGFRDYVSEHASVMGLEVIGGQPQSLFGGVFSASDPPFIDFNFRPGIYPGGVKDSFFAADNGYQAVAGRVTLSRAVVPEPGTLALLGIGALAVFMRRRAR